MSSTYRIYCNTEDAWVIATSDGEPTECPNDSGHTIDTNSIARLTLEAAEYFMTVKEASGVGDRKAVYISGSDEIKLSKADSESTIPCVGFTMASGSLDDIIIIQTNDELDGFTGLVSGSPYYLSQTTAGEITNVKPTSGIIIRVGVAKSSTELDLHVLRLYSPTTMGDSWQQPVKSKGLVNPPSTPTTDDRYVIGDSATGDWENHDGEITEWNGSSWVFAIPEEGWRIYVENENLDINYTGSAWETYALGGEGLFLAFGDSDDLELPLRTLRTPGGSTAGYILPSDKTITSLSLMTDVVNSNTFNVLKNGSLIHSVVFANQVSKVEDGLTLLFEKDSVITANIGTASSDIDNEYSADANTLFLAKFDGDNRDKRHVTNSSTFCTGQSGRIIGADFTTGGKFDRCVDFDGSNDYIQILHHDAYNVTDSTIEFFVNVDTLPEWQCFFSKDDNSGGIYIGSHNSNLYVSVGSEIYDGSTLTTGTWYHIAVVMGTGGLKIFLEGVLVHSDATTDGLEDNIYPIAVGASLEENDKDRYKRVNYFLNGRMCELRISENRRYETTGFTVPTAAFTADGVTVGLWHMSEASGYLIYDSSDVVHNAMMMADGSMCEIKTDLIKFGTHSIKMNGSPNDWLRINHNPHYEVSEVTVETWMRMHKDSKDGVIFQKGDSDTEGGLIISWHKDVGGLHKFIKVTYYGASTTRTLTTAHHSVEKNIWKHCAVVIHADYIKLFLDGVQQDAEALTTDFQNVWLNNKEDIYIGARNTRSDYHKSYYDEYRISDTVRNFGTSTSGVKEVSMLVEME